VWGSCPNLEELPALVPPEARQGCAAAKTAAACAAAAPLCEWLKPRQAPPGQVRPWVKPECAATCAARDARDCGRFPECEWRPANGTCARLAPGARGAGGAPAAPLSGIAARVAGCGTDRPAPGVACAPGAEAARRVAVGSLVSFDADEVAGPEGKEAAARAAAAAAAAAAADNGFDAGAPPAPDARGADEAHGAQQAAGAGRDAAAGGGDAAGAPRNGAARAGGAGGAAAAAAAALATAVLALLA
jgi:hypothetical protein